MKKFWSILVGVQVLLSAGAHAQTLQATVNRTEIPQGETFVLTLETDDEKTSGSPDLSVLDKDFTIYSVGNAFQSSYVNGVATHTRQWQVVLMPKNAGQIEIPEIKVGTLTSQPIQLNIVPANLAQQASASQSEGPKFAVDAKVDNTNPYVQQQINYTLSIYDSGGLYGEQPLLNDDGNSDWIIKSLGDPTINSKVVNGQRLREIQFHYALFPQKSGVLKTPDIEFRGYYLTRSRRGADAFEELFNDSFFHIGLADSMFATRNPVVLKPESITVNVQPIPASNGGYWWLPASQVVLSSEWENKNPTFRVGEAVGRSIYLKASGVTENQLPDITFLPISGMKQYPEKPLSMSSQHNGEIVSAKKFGNVFIPEREGTMTIPAVTVDWYNIHTGQLEKATLPAQTIEVLPALNNGTDPVEAEQPQTQPQVQPENIATQETAPVLKYKKPLFPTWLWMFAAFVLGVAMSYWLFGRQYHIVVKDKDAYRKAAEKALQDGKLKSLRNNLLAWARQAYQNDKIRNLDDMASQSETLTFKKQLSKLSEALYAPQETTFDKEAFLKAFKDEQKRHKKTSSTESPLPRLYR